MEYDGSNCMSDPQTPNSISQEPVNILFSPSSVAKKDVWDIDLIQILNLLIKNPYNNVCFTKTGKNAPIQEIIIKL